MAKESIGGARSSGLLATTNDSVSRLSERGATPNQESARHSGGSSSQSGGGVRPSGEGVRLNGSGGGKGCAGPSRSNELNRLRVSGS